MSKNKCLNLAVTNYSPTLIQCFYDLRKCFHSKSQTVWDGWGGKEVSVSLLEPHHEAPQNVQTDLTLSLGEPLHVGAAPQSPPGLLGMGKHSSTSPCCLPAADRCLWPTDNMAGGEGMLTHAQDFPPPLSPCVTQLQLIAGQRQKVGLQKGSLLERICADLTLTARGEAHWEVSPMQPRSQWVLAHLPVRRN